MKILLIEDDHDMAMTIKDALKKEFVVEMAFTGETGEYMAEVNKYDLIISYYYGLYAS